MARSELSSVSANDILSFTYEQLVQYMKQTLQPNGDIHLEVQGSEMLSSDQRELLAERLR
jgi:hypothetical protein